MNVYEYNPRRVVAGLVFALIGISFLLESLRVWTVDVAWVWPILLLGLGASMLLGKARREKVEEDRSAQLAVAEERVRIARELHDIVAHSVSLMTVQIAAARRVQKKKPEQAEQALEAAESTGRQALTELRNIVTVLRGADASIEAASFHPADEQVEEERPALAPLPGFGDIKSLVDNVRDAGLDVTAASWACNRRPAPACSWPCTGWCRKR